VTVSPTGTLSAGWSGHDAASETGAGALNATLDAASSYWLDTGLGLQLAYRADLAAGGTVTLTGRALWEHAFGDATPSQTLALAGGGSPYTVRGPDAGRDRLKLGAGIGFSPTPGTTLSLNYDGTLARGVTSHAFVAGLRATF
jgi:outer membrane autotransporter protein